MSANVRVLLLHADNANAETVEALLGMVRQVQTAGTGGAVLVEPEPAPVELLAPAKPRRKSARKNAKGSSRKCGNCGEVGHRADKCPSL